MPISKLFSYVSQVDSQVHNIHSYVNIKQSIGRCFWPSVSLHQGFRLRGARATLVHGSCYGSPSQGLFSSSKHRLQLYRSVLITQHLAASVLSVRFSASKSKRGGYVLILCTTLHVGEAKFHESTTESNQVLPAQTIHTLHRGSRLNKKYLGFRTAQLFFPLDAVRLLLSRHSWE